MMKTKWNNDMIECIGGVNTENDIELSWPIISDVNCDENQIWQRHDR